MKKESTIDVKLTSMYWHPWPNIDVIFLSISRQLLTSINGQKRGLNVNFFWREKGVIFYVKMTSTYWRQKEVNSWRLFDVGIWRQSHVNCLTSFWRQELTLLSRQKSLCFIPFFWPCIDDLLTIVCPLGKALKMMGHMIKFARISKKLNFWAVLGPLGPNFGP